jgi:hypothetical protein
VASPTEDSVLVVAIEIQDAQTAKESFGSDSVAGSVGDADAIHTSVKTVVEALRSLNQIFSKGPNFAAIEKSFKLELKKDLKIFSRPTNRVQRSQL